MSINSELKRTALETLHGKWGDSILCTFIAGAITMAVSTITGLGIIVSPVFTWGLHIYFLELNRGEKGDLARIFDGFKDFGRVWVAMFLSGLFAFLWGLLFIIPGIIKSLSYAMVPYLIKDNPKLEAMEAIKESQRMMDGHKMELFMLYLSFMGWWILTILTFGLGWFALLPYIRTTKAAFYETLKSEQPTVKE